MTLTQRQLDKEMVESGKSRYWRRTEKAKHGERESDTDHGTRLLNAAVYPVSQAQRKGWLVGGSRCPTSLRECGSRRPSNVAADRPISSSKGPIARANSPSLTRPRIGLC